AGPLYQQETSPSLSLHSWPSTPQAMSTVFSLAPDSEILTPSGVCWISRVSNLSLPSWLELSCHVPLSSGRSAAKAAAAARAIRKNKGRTSVSFSPGISILAFRDLEQDTPSRPSSIPPARRSFFQGTVGTASPRGYEMMALRTA